MADKILTPSVDPATIKEQASSVSGDKEKFPCTRGQVTPLIDASVAFKKMYEYMKDARDYIYLSGWYIQSQSLINGVDKHPSFKELLKDLVKKNKSIKIRILISYLPTLIFPDAKAASSFKKEMLSLNPPGKLKPIQVQIFEHPFYRTVEEKKKGKKKEEKKTEKKKVVLGTSHDKFMVIDGKFAFCGGMEFTVEYNKTDHRHDVHSFIEGPVVSHLEHHFVTHWKEARANANTSDADDAGDLSVTSSSSFDPKKTTHAVQVSITKSKDGIFNYTKLQQDVFETYKVAIEAATKYVYIENQYFRDMELAKIIESRIKKIPALQVIIILPHEAEEKPKDPKALELTEHAVYVQYQTIDHLRSKDTAQKNVGFFSLQKSRKSKTYVHAKVMIVDDLWFTIGSANTNPRSFYLDAETNISVRDNTAAKDFRIALWQEHFGPERKKTESHDWDISNAAKFLEIWNKEGDGNANNLMKGRGVSSWVVRHEPAPGKKRESKFGEPDIDMLVLEGPSEFRWPDDEQEAMG